MPLIYPDHCDILHTWLANSHFSRFRHKGKLFLKFLALFFFFFFFQSPPRFLFFSISVSCTHIQMSKTSVESYYKSKIDEGNIIIQDASKNLRRLTATRNDLNTRGKWWSKWKFWKKKSKLFYILSIFTSSHASRGIGAPFRARFACWRGHKGHGEN